MRTGGTRAKTRKLFQAYLQDGEKIRRLMTDYEKGEKVLLKADPSEHKGLLFRRFYGMIGVVNDFRGKTGVLVQIIDGDKKKIIMTTRAHLVKL